MHPPHYLQHKHVFSIHTLVEQANDYNFLPMFVGSTAQSAVFLKKDILQGTYLP